MAPESRPDSQVLTEDIAPYSPLWQNAGEFLKEFYSWLWLKEQRRSADACCLEVNRELHPIGNFYERDAATQLEIPAIEPQSPFDLARASPFPFSGEGQ